MRPVTTRRPLRRSPWTVAPLLVTLAAGAFPGGAPTAARAPGFEIRVSGVDGRGTQALAGVPAAAPAWSPREDRIAFIGSVPGQRDGAAIFSVGADGGGLTELIRLREDDPIAIAWSPDGARIAFAASNGSTTRLRVINADGTGRRTLAGSVNEDFATPSWSPDAKRLTFVRGEARESRLSVVDADGTGLRTLRRIGLDTDDGGLPRWSPDGRRIAYVDVWRDRFQVFTIHPDGRGRHPVGGTSCSLDPAWRPDGRGLACVGFDRSADRARFAINVLRRGGRISRSLAAGGSRSYPASPMWSPDASRLAFLRRRGDGFALRLIDADGRHNRLLTRHPSVLSGVPATFSPDGARIAFGVAPLLHLEATRVRPDIAR